MSSRYALPLSIARLAYRVPFVKSITRSSVRRAIQSERLGLKTRQRLYNFFAKETTKGLKFQAEIATPNAESIHVELHLDEDLDRNWYFWGYSGYEAGLPEFICHRLQKQGYQRIIEVGANIGYFSLLMASAVSKTPNSIVDVFEPFDSVFQQLKTNANLNPTLPLRLHHAAASDVDGSVELFLPADEHAKTNASLVAGLFDQNRSVQIQSVRLDTWASTQPDMKIDFLKMDCEGAEPAVINGARNRINKDRPEILCEVLPSTEDVLDRMFTELNYAKFQVVDQHLQRVDQLVARSESRDYLLLPTERADSSVPKT